MYLYLEGDITGRVRDHEYIRSTCMHNWVTRSGRQPVNTRHRHSDDTSERRARSFLYERVSIHNWPVGAVYAGGLARRVVCTLGMGVIHRLGGQALADDGGPLRERYMARASALPPTHLPDFGEHILKSILLIENPRSGLVHEIQSAIRQGHGTGSIRDRIINL